MTAPNKIPTAWKRAVLHLAGYEGGWWMPVVCAGGGKHPPRILCHVYEHAVYGVAYTAPPETVTQTRQLAAVGVPGRSRQSIRFTCPFPTCTQQPSVTRKHWAEICDNARRVEQSWLDTAHLH